MVSNSVLDEMHLVIYMYAFVCCSWCACLQVCVSILVSRGDFSVFLLPRRCNHILAPSQWQLVGMHIVIKQFPVCKCPVYTSLLQSLSLDRLLEYEESSYTMKNENSKTSIKKKSIVPALGSRHPWNWCHREDPEFHTAARTQHIQITKRSRPLFTTARWHSLMEEAVEKLLLDITRKNNSEWRDEVLGCKRGVSEN